MNQNFFSTPVFIELVYAVFFVFLVVLALLILKCIARVPKGSLGVELNLLTYGYLIDTIMKWVRGEPFWVNISPNYLLEFKAAILITIIILNTGLLGWNFHLVYRIETEKELSKYKRFGLKFLSLLIGFISLVIFLTFKTNWR